MDVIILAGGLGTRLRSVVNDVPKCMAPIHNRPFLYYLLIYLKRCLSIDKVILSLGYKYEVVTNWIEQQTEFPFPFVYSIENTPLGTGGAIKKALSYSDTSEILVLNGDTFFNIDLNSFLKEHQTSAQSLSLALKSMSEFDRYGNVILSPHNSILDFQEKGFCKLGQINAGVYLLNNKDVFFNALPDKFSFEKEVLEPLAKTGKICGFVHDGYFIDIGIPEDYEKANREFSSLFNAV